LVTLLKLNLFRPPVEYVRIAQLSSQVRLSDLI